MNSQNMLVAVSLLIQLAEAAQRFGNLLMVARSENRDITRDELEQLQKEDNLARTRLQDLIDAKLQSEANFSGNAN